MQPSNVHPETMRKTQAANAGRDLSHILDDDIAKARLAEAAPDMLKALEAVLKFTANQMWHVAGGNRGSHAQTLYNQMEAAVARATGDRQ